MIEVKLSDIIAALAEVEHTLNGVPFQEFSANAMSEPKFTVRLSWDKFRLVFAGKAAEWSTYSASEFLSLTVNGVRYTANRAMPSLESKSMVV